MVFTIADPLSGGAENPPVLPPATGLPDNGGVPPTWRIYYIRRLADSVGYVGVTQRTLPVRLTVHDRDARLHPKVGGPGTVAAAIRQVYAEGKPCQAAFQAELLAETSLPDEARRMEQAWIARLGTAAPAVLILAFHLFMSDFLATDGGFGRVLFAG